MDYLTTLIGLMMRLQPYEPRARVAEIAQAIVLATPSREERAVLVIVSEYETTFGRPGSVPFGLSCCQAHLVDRSLVGQARRFLRIWHDSARQCGANAALYRRFGYFHSGRCDGLAHNKQRVYVRDNYVRYEANAYRRLLRALP